MVLIFFRLFARLRDFYFDNQSNQGVLQTIVAINKRHQEVLKDYSSKILPLIFFAMHEPTNNENLSNVESWRELWNDASPGDAGIRMNIDQIVEMLEKSLTDSVWSIKAQAANAINTIATRLGKNLGNAERNRMIQALLQALTGRTYEGKERLLEALSSLSHGLEKSELNIQVINDIIDALMRECKKEDPVYKAHALKSLGVVLEQLEEDRFEQLYDMIGESIIDSSDEEEKKLPAEERSKRTTLNLKEVCCITMGMAWPVHSLETQEKYQVSTNIR